MEDSKRARSWKRRIRPRINLKNDERVLYSTRCFSICRVIPFPSLVEILAASPGKDSNDRYIRL